MGVLIGCGFWLLVIVDSFFLEFGFWFVCCGFDFAVWIVVLLLGFQIVILVSGVVLRIWVLFGFWSFAFSGLLDVRFALNVGLKLRLVLVWCRCLSFSGFRFRYLMLVLL